MNVTAIVVTYNRPALLRKALRAIEDQSRPPQRLLVVDNGSGPDTVELLQQVQASTTLDMRVVRAPGNLGGAGGFALGMQQAENQAGHWLWIMDDDAEPDSHCLERLLELAERNPRSLIGPAAVGHPPHHHTLCWPAATPAGATTRQLDALREPWQVFALPFLGLLVPASAVEQIGLPEARLFISGDDVDFTLRARQAGYTLFLHPGAILYHPLPSLKPIRVLHRTIWLQDIPPWKRYFEVRNRLWLARRHHGLLAQAGVFGVTLMRLGAALVHSSDKRQQSRAFLHGMADGLLGRLERRPLGPH